MLINSIIKEISQKLELASDVKTKESGERFFKEKVKMHGVKTATAISISKEYYKQIKGKTKEEIFSLCEELWQTGYMDESFIACNWSYNVHKEFEEKDIQTFETWIDKYVNNWASCDTFCNHTVGEFIMMYPKYISKLKQWAKSKNRWMKRASAVSLIIPARKGLFLNDVFEIADTLLLDTDDMVQKGYGWMLKVAANMHEKEVFDYVMKNKSNMPRTALRYAIEKMPKELKTQAMAK
jgi:3-methyladenine DNA glycosylase AlkD